MASSCFLLPPTTILARPSTANRLPLPHSSTHVWMLPKCHPSRIVPIAQAGDGDRVLRGPFSGRYGQWNFRQSDSQSVRVYRSALSLLFVSLSMLYSTCVFDISSSSVFLDSLYFVAMISLRMALHSIHIYLKPLHQLLNRLWLAGFIGSFLVRLAPLGEQGVVNGLYHSPVGLILAGWWIVAMTGVFVKEAVCFQRAEAGVLMAVIPVVVGGHFLGIVGRQVEIGAAGIGIVALAVFCVRKWLQDEMDDVGDLSVFEYLEKGGQL